MSKRVALLLLLVLACWALSGCYMEPDRVVDNNNGLTVADGGQNFESVITNTPAATQTPTPKPTDNQQVDWANWNFGDDTATNPPSNANNPGNITPITTQAPGTAATIGVTTASPAPNATATKKPAAVSTSLKSGSKGGEVKKLQQRLKDLGYYTGSVDGSYGSGTVKAVKDFQNANNLTADGVAGKSTLAAVNSSNAIKKNNTNTPATKKPSGSNNGNNNNSNSNSYTHGRTDVYLKLGSSGAQ
ncbi:MAG: peptidoglycan-binding protein, partial [Clostridia bacterium]